MASKYDHVRKVERRLTVHWKAGGRGRGRGRRICMWHGGNNRRWGRGREGSELTNVCVNIGGVGRRRRRRGGGEGEREEDGEEQ